MRQFLDLFHDSIILKLFYYILQLADAMEINWQSELKRYRMPLLLVVLRKGNSYGNKEHIDKNELLGSIF